MAIGRQGAGFSHLGGVLGGASNYVFVNSEAAAVAAAFTTPPTNARKAQIDSLVGSLKSAGVWSVLDVLYITAAADSQAATINWISPASFTLLPVNSPSFQADRGFTGNGTTSRVRTQYTPSVNGVNYTLNSASLTEWSLTELQSTAADIGSATAPRAFIDPRNASNLAVVDVNNTSGSLQPASTTSLGFFMAQRRASNDIRLWQNGTQIGSGSIASGSVASTEQWICGSNSTNFSTRQIAAAAWGASLSGLESAFYSAVRTYMLAVGAIASSFLLVAGVPLLVDGMSLAAGVA